MIVVPQSEEYHRITQARGKSKKKTEIVYGEFSDVAQYFSGVVLCVFPEGNKACKGSDKSSHTPEINPDKKVGIIFGKH